MNSKFLTLVVIAAVVAVGTYLGLNHVVPYQKEEAKVAQTVPVESVFSGGLQAPAAGEPADAAAAPAATPAAPTAPAPSAESNNVPTESATVSPQAEQPAAEPAAAAKPAAAPAPSKPENVAAAEPAAPKDAEPAPAVKPAAKPAPAPVAKAEPAKKPEAKAAPAAQPKAAPAAKPAASKPAAAAPAPAAAPAKMAAAPAATAPWWGPSDASHLSLIYVGSAAFQKAIVLMFNGEFSSTDSANANLQVADAKGAKVAGSWKIGPSNKRMLVFPVNSSGKYTVSVKTGLADGSGRTVAQEARGPVTVQ